MLDSRLKPILANSRLTLTKVSHEKHDIIDATELCLATIIGTGTQFGILTGLSDSFEYLYKCSCEYCDTIEDGLEYARMLSKLDDMADIYHELVDGDLATVSPKGDKYDDSY